MAGGLNTYGYAYQNPLLYTDPYGLVPPAAGRAAGAGTIPGVPAGSPGGEIDWSQPWLPPSVSDAINNFPNTVMCGMYGWSKDDLHGIKDAAQGGMGTGKSWTGVAPNGTVGINEDGQCIVDPIVKTNTLGV